MKTKLNFILILAVISIASTFTTFSQEYQARSLSDLPNEHPLNGHAPEKEDVYQGDYMPVTLVIAYRKDNKPMDKNGFYASFVHVDDRSGKIDSHRRFFFKPEDLTGSEEKSLRFAYHHSNTPAMKDFTLYYAGKPKGGKYKIKVNLQSKDQTCFLSENIDTIGDLRKVVSEKLMKLTSR